tara:strand:- start:68 stop:265 length:198 start_codon:yes stop_codon:yes gene_type:complete
MNNIKEESLEQQALKAMTGSELGSISWDDIVKEISEKEEEFNKEVNALEKLDIEAQYIASTFYVR